MTYFIKTSKTDVCFCLRIRILFQELKLANVNVWHFESFVEIEEEEEVYLCLNIDDEIQHILKFIRNRYFNETKLDMHWLYESTHTRNRTVIFQIKLNFVIKFHREKPRMFSFNGIQYVLNLCRCNIVCRWVNSAHVPKIFFIPVNWEQKFELLLVCYFCSMPSAPVPVFHS